MNTIKLTLPGGALPVNGKQITFKAPCPCTETEALEIDGVRYTVVDTLGSCITGKGGRWVAGATVSVILDVDNKQAYIQNEPGGISAETAALLGLQVGAPFDDALERLNSITNEKAVISTGSYTPSENVHGYSLTFDFEPQMLMIFKAGARTVPMEVSSQSAREDRGITFVKGCTTYPTYGEFGPCNGGYSIVKTDLTVSFDSNTVSWSLPDTEYFTGYEADVPAYHAVAGGEGAFCDMNETYRYIAIGIGVNGGNGGSTGDGEVSDLPNVTAADNGKILQVVDGTWMAVAVADSVIKTYIDEVLGGEN